MSKVVIAFAEVWNGDFTRSYIYNVYKDKEIALRETAKNELPAFSNYRFETWNVSE